MSDKDWRRLWRLASMLWHGAAVAWMLIWAVSDKSQEQANVPWQWAVLCILFAIMFNVEPKD